MILTRPTPLHSGGALNTGSSDRFFYDPTSLVRSQSGPAERCIIVTGNYRVNIFGFCASDDLSNEDADGLSGNYGLYDAMKIFEWVRARIPLVRPLRGAL